MFRRYSILLLLPLWLLVLACAGCNRRAPEEPFNSKSGFVSHNHTLSTELLRPDSVRLDWEFDEYYLADHLAFVGQGGTNRYLLSVTAGRAMRDNPFIRAERDFSGYLFDGQKWIRLSYTRARHDSLRLDAALDYYFCKLTWDSLHTSGHFSYNRREAKFDLTFADLRPVQGFASDSTRRRVHAVGQGVLMLGPDTLTGTVFYELTQLEGYSPVTELATPIEFINYDWLALLTESGEPLLVNSDSAFA